VIPLLVCQPFRFSVFISLVLGLMTATAAAQTATPVAPFTTPAPYAILMDSQSGTVLFEKAADQLNSPASLAKIMTAEVVFQAISGGRLHLDDTYTISQNAWRKGGAPAGGSTMYAALNSQVRIEDLIRGLVIQSGNDAAIALAEGLAGSEEAFAALMTARARELGLKNLSFRNPWGKFDPDQKVTMREMALLSNHIIKTYPELYRYFGEREFTWNKIKQQNRNRLLTMNIGADGLKTGNIEDAGFGLVASAVENGQRLILAINGLKSAKDRDEEGRRLLVWGFRSFDARTLFAANDIIGQAQVYGGAQREVPLVTDGPVRVFIPKGNSEKMTGRIVYEGPLLAPLEAGKSVASLKIYRGSTLIVDQTLKTAESIEQGTNLQRAMDAGLELGIELFRTYVLKK
jgi:D-alanyl-D-alanine carboxypeptidase (penicillin-binding protein 5/6)